LVLFARSKRASRDIGKENEESVSVSFCVVVVVVVVVVFS